MASTLQKKIKFSKGQIVKNLQERTDLEIFDSSASEIKNFDVTLFGGLTKRETTDRIAEIKAYSSANEIDYTATSNIGGDVDDLKTDTQFISSGTDGQTTYLEFDLGEEKTDFLFQVNQIKFDYVEPVVWMVLPKQSAGVYDFNSTITTFNNAGVGVNGSLVPDISSRPYLHQLTNTLVQVLDNAGTLTSVSGELKIGSSSQQSYDEIRVQLKEVNHTTNSAIMFVETSSDGITWTREDYATISETAIDFQTSIASARYIRLTVDSNVISRLAIDKIVILQSGAEEDVGEVKLVDFVFNNIENYLFVLIKGRIDIYKLVYGNPVFIETVSAIELTDEIIENIKWTYKDDTIVFTHEKLEPHQLVRQADNDWAWSSISLQSIPQELFGNATITPKTVTLTPDRAEGIVTLTAGSSVFDVNYEGQVIDGNGGRLRVTKYISATKVSGYTIIPFYNTDSFSSWNYESGYEAVWSASKGYPRCCCIANERLFFAGTPTKPNTIWASRIADYYNFKNAGNYDNDSISFTMNTNAVIYDMIFNRGLHIFTSDYEASSPENSFTPNSFKVIPTTKNGIDERVRPIILDGQVLYVSNHKLMNYVYSDTVNSYESENLSKLTNILQYQTVDMDIVKGSSESPVSRIYIIDIAGQLSTITISLSDEIFAPSVCERKGEYKQVCAVGGVMFAVVKIAGKTFLEKLNYTENLGDSGHRLTVTDYMIHDSSMKNDEFIYKGVGNLRAYGKFDNNGDARVEVENGIVYVGYPVKYKLVGNQISINHKTGSIKKRIAKATVMCKGKEIIFCGQTKQLNDMTNYHPVEFYACTLYGKDITYNIEGTESLDILSIELNINYEG